MKIHNIINRKYPLRFVLVSLLFIACNSNRTDEPNLQKMSKAAGMAETSQIKNAEDLLTPLLASNPNWGEGWIYLGRSLAAQGRYSEGADAVEKGGVLGERCTSVWLEASSMALNSGNEQLAGTYLARGLQGTIHRPWLIQSSSFDGFLDLDNFLDTDAARKLLLEASKRRPSLHPDLIAIERRLNASSKEESQVLVNKYETTVKTLPEDGELYYRLGKIQVRVSNYKDALISFQRSKDWNYLPVLNDGWLAHVYAQLEEKDAAFEHLDRNLASNDTPNWIFYPGEFEPLHDDSRWKEIVDKYRPTNTPSFQLPVKEQDSIPYPTKKWSKTAPEKVGLNESTLLEAAHSIEQHFPNVASLLVIRKGQLVFERYFNGYNDQDAFNIKSATKSFTSTIAGIMHDQGILPDLQTPIAEIIPEYFADIDDPLKRQITLEHLLTMTAGLDWVEGDEQALGLFLTGNYAELLLKEKQLYRPGEVYEYSSAVSHLLAVILAKRSGQNLLDYAQENLFEPLGIKPEVWAQDLNGYYLGDGELRLRPRDFAKFGLLILRGGKWEEKSVVSTDWIREATAIQIPEAGGPHTSYGYQFWILNVGGYRVIRAAGYGGQRCWIIPSLDMVVVITSEPLEPDNNPEAILGQWILPSVVSNNND